MRQRLPDHPFYPSRLRRLHEEKISSDSRDSWMKIAPGQKTYSVGSKPVTGEGLAFNDTQLDHAIKHRAGPLIRDDVGKALAVDLLSGLAKTSFAADALKQALNAPRAVADWQVGEALADAYLTDHCNCSFPWPIGRDLRNPNASPAGADLVGFQQHSGKTRFAFGEVKTSSDSNCPPQVMTGRHGLIAQLEELRDSTALKSHLMLYLAHRAQSAVWQSSFQQAAERYLQNASDVSLFGFLIRDVPSNKADLESRTTKLAIHCPAPTVIELRALYLPQKSVESLAKKTGGAK